MTSVLELLLSSSWKSLENKEPNLQAQSQRQHQRSLVNISMHYPCPRHHHHKFHTHGGGRCNISSRGSREMASSSKAGSITVLVLRVFVFLFLLVSLVVIATDTVTVPDSDSDTESVTTTLGFKDVIAYRYVFSVAVIGCVYTLLQLPFAALNTIRGKKFIGTNTFPLYIFIDLVFSLLFASGVGAGFGITVDLKRYLDKAARGDDGESSVTNDIDKALDLVHVSTGFVLVATVCMAFIILTSTFALAKK